jgi:hypothetical protein
MIGVLMSGSNLYPPREQLTLLNQELVSRSRVQLDELDGLDRKASTFVAATGVVLGLVGNNANSFASSADLVRYAFLAAVLLFAFSLICGLFEFWPRRLLTVPDGQGLVDKYYALLPEPTLASLVSTRADALRNNDTACIEKFHWLRRQMLCFAIGSGLLVFAFVALEWK